MGLFVAAIVLFLAIYGFNKTKKESEKVLFSLESNYYKIKVVKGAVVDTPVKMLIMDTDIHSVERVDGKDLPIYTNIYPVFSIFNDKIKEVLVIGGGSYFLAKKFLSSILIPMCWFQKLIRYVTAVAEKFLI